MLVDELVKYGGLVLGAIGTTGTVVGMLRGRARYVAHVSVAYGKVRASKRSVHVAIINAGNQPFSVRKAYYTTDPNSSSAGRRITFYEPTPDRIVNATPGQTATITFEFIPTLVSPDEVVVEIHNNRTFRAAIDHSDEIYWKRLQFLAEVVRRALSTHTVTAENVGHRGRLVIVRKIGRLAEGQSAPPPIVLDVPHSIERRDTGIPCDHDLLAFKTRTTSNTDGPEEAMMYELQKSLPAIFEICPEPEFTRLLWVERVRHLATDPADLRAIEAETGITTDELDVDPDKSTAYWGFYLFAVLVLVFLSQDKRKRAKERWDRWKISRKRSQLNHVKAKVLDNSHKKASRDK